MFVCLNIKNKNVQIKKLKTKKNFGVYYSEVKFFKFKIKINLHNISINQINC